MGKKEPTNQDILNVLLQILNLMNLIVAAAREGGGMIPQVNYQRMQKWRVKLKTKGFTKIKCKKECKRGPCRYGTAQALQCYEIFEKEINKLKKRRLLKKHIPYTIKQLHQFSRRELMMLAGILKLDVRAMMYKKKGLNNEALIAKILKVQPEYVKRREKREMIKQKARDRIRANDLTTQGLREYVGRLGGEEEKAEKEE